MSKPRRSKGKHPESGLSKAQRARWDKYLRRLLKYFQMPEGVALAERISRLKEVTQARREQHLLKLTGPEKKAFAFIQKELSAGRQPSVRGVARAIGRRSSRSGMKIINRLVAQSYLDRDEAGRLRLRMRDTKSYPSQKI